MQPQLVVYETESCGWCRAFREDIAPVYMRSKHASWATLRYVDLNDADDGKQFKLARGISALPTLVLVDTAGREVSRMSGHPGEPANVYRFLDKNSRASRLEPRPGARGRPQIHASRLRIRISVKDGSMRSGRLPTWRKPWRS